MKLLIVGAGGHCEVIKEIAEELGYEKISYLDDDSIKAIGTIDDISKFKEYEHAICSFGKNKLREEVNNKLIENGFRLPVLIQPSAYISKSAKIGEGTVIEANAMVNSDTVIGKGCLISTGAIIDHNAEVEEYAYVDSGAVVEAGAYVGKYEKIAAGGVKKK